MLRSRSTRHVTQKVTLPPTQTVQYWGTYGISHNTSRISFLPSLTITLSPPTRGGCGVAAHIILGERVGLDLYQRPHAFHMSLLRSMMDWSRAILPGETERGRGHCQCTPRAPPLPISLPPSSHATPTARLLRYDGGDGTRVCAGCRGGEEARALQSSHSHPPYASPHPSHTHRVCVHTHARTQVCVYLCV